MIYIKNFVHDYDSSTITFEVEREGVTNHVETRDTGYGTTSTDINDFTEDWSDSEYNQLESFLHSHLKPCPFCGSENISFNTFNISLDAYVLCEQCNASIEISVPWDGMDEKEHDEVCLKKLSVLWNKRASERNQSELNPDQQTVLDWLKTNVKQDNVSPMCAVFLLGEWQTRIGLKELGSVDISYCRLNPKHQARVLQVFGEWCNEREEANESNS